MYRNRVLGIAAWLNLVVVCASGGAHGTRQEGLRVFQPLASPNSTVQERWRSSTFDIIASTEPRSLPLGLQHDTAASQRLAVLPACGASLPRRYDQLHVYEQLRVWESADCYNPLLFNTSQHANRSQTKSSQVRSPIPTISNHSSSYAHPNLVNAAMYLEVPCGRPRGAHRRHRDLRRVCTYRF